MKTKEIIAGLVTLAAAMTTYYIIRQKQRKNPVSINRTHHLTDVFSKAKAHAK